MRQCLFAAALSIATLTAWGARANFLVNPGFETGNFSGWTVDGSLTNAYGVGQDGAPIAGTYAGFPPAYVNAIDGTYSAYAAIAATSGQKLLLTQSVYLTPGNYSVGFSVAATKNQPTQFYGGNSHIFVNSNLLSDNGGGQYGSTPESYADYFSVASAGSVTIEFSLSGSGTAAAGFSFDDFYVQSLSAVTDPPATSVPEPATLSVLGIALLGIAATSHRTRIRRTCGTASIAVSLDNRFRIPVLSAGAAAILALASAPSHASQLITNGDFETGDLTGWGIKGYGTTGVCGTAPRDFNVGTSGAATGCAPVVSPISGQYAVYNMFDGPGPLTYTLGQGIAIPIGTTGGTLSFLAASGGENEPGRTLAVAFYGDSDQLISNALTIPDTALPNQWTLESVDVSAVLAANAGQTIQIRFNAYVPEVWSGPNGLGIDAISLTTATSFAAVPEPGGLLLLGGALLGLSAVRRLLRP